METEADLRHPEAMFPIPLHVFSILGMIPGEQKLLGTFTWIDWLVVLAFLVLTTWVGHRKSGEQATIRDFFLGGRKLPWYAVSASIVATEISALTFIGLPSVVFKEGGDFTYLQLGLIGALIARCVVAFIFVPAYYEREIYSPYDYMANRFGDRARTVVTVLFAIGGVLGQAARVYLTALVLQILIGPELAAFELATGVSPLVSSVFAIGIVAVAWTWMGGIAAVVWTDTILFVVFLLGICVVIGTVALRIDGGLVEIASKGYEVGKFRLLDFSTDWSKPYTFWAALFASSFWMAGMYGTDQMMAQRFFCCKNQKEAKKAVLAAYSAMGVTLMVGFVGVALFVWYAQNPLEGEALSLFESKADKIFAIFLVDEIPVGLKGLVMAGVFAAAISSLDSVMAALSQTVLSATWIPLRKREIKRLAAQGIAVDEVKEARTALRYSRWLVLFWAVILCGVAIWMEWVSNHYKSILDLGLAMATFTAGGLLAGFALAFSRLPISGRGYTFSAPLSVLFVFSISWHQPFAQELTMFSSIVILFLWITSGVRRVREEGVTASRFQFQSLLLLAGLVGSMWLSANGTWQDAGETKILAFVWYPLIGSLIAFFWGWGLSDPAQDSMD